MSGTEPNDEPIRTARSRTGPTRTGPPGPDAGSTSAEPLGTLGSDDLDGHTIDELTDYLDAGMTPRDPSIDDSPACQNVLAAILRLRATSVESLDAAAGDERPADEGWLAGLMSNITLEARAGRDIPYRSEDPEEVASVTEGAVRALVRSAGDAVAGIVVERCELDGDVTVPDEPVRVHVTVTVRLGRRMTALADDLRAAVRSVLTRHTDLAVAAVDVTVRDVLTSQEERA